MTRLKKKHKIPLFWGPLCPNLNKNEFSTKIRLCHFLASLVPLLHVKNQKKLMSQFQEKPLTN